MDEENGHISTRVMGTFGYVAPEYAMTGHLLVKSDVYSYGVVLLELLTGRKPVDMSQPPGEENLVAWARPLLTSKEGLEAIIDPNLGSEVPFESIAKVAAIASMCVQPEVSHRPFMGEVVQALKLVCNEYDEVKELGSRNSSRCDLSIDVADDTNTTSGQLPDTFQNQYSMLTYNSDLETGREASLSKICSTSMSTGRQDTESFRRHSSSGPLGTGRGKQFWERLRRSSGGSVTEHGFKLWQGSPH
ncbi:nascent polypeptide-associated complex subunit alpha [Pyrus ussuriensis x Pyrus communis]|uniref:Nascent polypeptide-associated complex subunit alpha n=1 Tax=Pyrus ussuriensis x Pyrus communis TaxID=2448454 RepID=A0A5N5GVR5_9ROSA|nr:nascent polypeptide-associated complex subunit alpha [Pyrus ussuriensis x Pyrus communis]